MPRGSRRSTAALVLELGSSLAALRLGFVEQLLGAFLVQTLDVEEVLRLIDHDQQADEEEDRTRQLDERGQAKRFSRRTEEPCHAGRPEEYQGEMGRTTATPMCPAPARRDPHAPRKSRARP